jgi:hypothetical protein
VHAALIVEDKFLGKQVKDFAIGRQRDAASFIDCKANLIARDLAGSRTQAKPAMAVHAAHVRTSDSEKSMFDRGAANVFGLLYRFLNRRYRFFEVDNHAFAGTTRFGNSMSTVAEAGVGDLCHQHASLGAAHVNGRQKIVILIRHAYG